MTEDQVEKVAKAIEAVIWPLTDWEGDRGNATAAAKYAAQAAIKASHHAELVAELAAYRIAYEEDEDKIKELVVALERVKYRLGGYADVDGAIAIVDEALAKIGGGDA